MTSWRARAGVAGAALAALAIAWTWAAATLDGWLVSDDFLLNVYRGGGADGMAVVWGEVFADFVRPWLGAGYDFYRPLLSVSFAADIARSSGHPARALHEQNLLLHAVTIVAAAWLAALHAPGRRALGALLGGALVAAHPVGVEPAAWIAARNSGLEVAVRTTALLAFALALRSRGRAWWITAFALAALALTAKESAVLLPVSMLALDLLHRPGRPLTRRLRIHLAFAPLWLGYMALRIALFGSFAGSGGVAEPPEPAAMVTAFVHKLQALFVPETLLDPGRAAAAPSLAWITAAAWLALLVTARRRPWVVLLGAVWLALHAAPTFALRLSPGLGGSRMIWGAVPALGVVATVALLGARRDRLRWFTALGWIAALAAVWGGAAQIRVAAYHDAWRDLRDAERALAEVAAEVTPARPLGLAGMPESPVGVPPGNPNLWFGVFERPAPIGDVPLRSLGFVTVAGVPGSEHLHHDPGPVRAMLENGAPVATWLGDQRRFAVRTPLAPDDTLPPLRRDGPTRWSFPAPIRADRVAAIDLAVTGVAADDCAGRIEWICAVPDLPANLAGIDFAGGARIDLTHALGLASLATVGVPIAGLRVTLTGPGAVETLAARPRLVALPIPDLGGALLDFDELERALGSMPPAPVDVDPRGGRLVLLAPHTALTVALAPGEPVRLPAALRQSLRTIGRMARQDAVQAYFEYAPTARRPGGARSPWTWARWND